MTDGIVKMFSRKDISMFGRLLIYYFLICSLFLSGCDTVSSHFIYRPNETLQTVDISSAKEKFSEIIVTTNDGVNLRGLESKNTINKPKAVIVYFHGNGGNAASASHAVSELPTAGYRVVVADYRGYGDNAGTPSEKGLYSDAQAFLAYAKAHADGAPVIVVGHSLGSAVALYLASSESVSGVMTLGAFTKIADNAPEAFSWAVKDRFDNTVMAHRVRAPWLIVHGQMDDIIPHAQGVALALEVKDEPSVSGRFISLRDQGHSFEPGVVRQLVLGFTEYLANGRSGLLDSLHSPPPRV